MAGQRRDGADVVIPEIADYEGPERAGRGKSVERLDALAAILHYIPINTAMIRRAASLWAEARRRCEPPADPHALDGDVILAAQPHEVGGIVVTKNLRHMRRFVEARLWQDIE